jgi:hypothetical protein
VTHHTVTIVVHRKNPVTRDLEFLVMDYQWRLPLSQTLSDKEVRFPTGTNRLHPHETPEQTACRKLFEETGLIAWRLKQIDTDPFYNKYGFLADLDECGMLCFRTSSLTNPSDGDEMSAPFWRTITQLDFGVLSSSHQWVYDAACDEVCAAA